MSKQLNLAMILDTSVQHLDCLRMQHCVNAINTHAGVQYLPVQYPFQIHCAVVDYNAITVQLSFNEYKT